MFPIFEAGVEEVGAAARELALQVVPRGTEPWLRHVTFNDLGCAQGEEGLLQESSSLCHFEFSDLQDNALQLKASIGGDPRKKARGEEEEDEEEEQCSLDQAGRDQAEGGDCCRAEEVVEPAAEEDLGEEGKPGRGNVQGLNVVEEDHDEASKEKERGGQEQNESTNHIGYQASTRCTFGLHKYNFTKQVAFLHSWPAQVIFKTGCFSAKREENLFPPPSPAPPASHGGGVVTL